MPFHISEWNRDIVMLIKDDPMDWNQRIRCSILEQKENIYRNHRRFRCHPYLFLVQEAIDV